MSYIIYNFWTITLLFIGSIFIYNLSVPLLQQINLQMLSYHLMWLWLWLLSFVILHPIWNQTSTMNFLNAFRQVILSFSSPIPQCGDNSHYSYIAGWLLGLQQGNSKHCEHFLKKYINAMYFLMCISVEYLLLSHRHPYPLETLFTLSKTVEKMLSHALNLKLVTAAGAG